MRNMSLVTRSIHVMTRNQGATGTVRIGTQGTVDASLANIETVTEAETDIVIESRVVRDGRMGQRRKSLLPSRRAFPVCL
jgi:hypothetical protein